MQQIRRFQAHDAVVSPNVQANIDTTFPLPNAFLRYWRAPATTKIKYASGVDFPRHLTDIPKWFFAVTKIVFRRL